MATTKAAKSITINATKYELANALGVADGKIQLKAKDVVLSEVEAPGGGEFVITLDDEQDLSVAGSKSCTTFAAADLLAAIEAGKTIKIIAHDVLDSNDNYTNNVVIVPSCRDSFEGVNIWMSAGLNTIAGHKTWDILCAGQGDVSSVIFRDATPVVSKEFEINLTSDISLAQVGVGAGWRPYTFTANVGNSWSDMVDAFTDSTPLSPVYLTVMGSGHKITAKTPVTLSRKFAGDMWTTQFTFVADGSVFTLDENDGIKRG